MISADTITQWREDWSSASVDPTIRQPCFDLPCYTWSLMNCFRTGQVPCLANLHKWGLAQSPSCDCGQRQTMNHIVDTCPLTKFECGLNLLHEADDDAVIWLKSTATAALTNKSYLCDLCISLFWHAYIYRQVKRQKFHMFSGSFCYLKCQLLPVSPLERFKLEF